MKSRNRFPVIGQEVYPSPSADKRGRRVEWTPYRRCIQCGLPNDTRSTAWSERGDGIGESYDVEFDGTTQDNVKDRDVTSGCRFCGSKQWQHSKPRKLPDDKNFPSSRWRGLRR